MNGPCPGEAAGVDPREAPNEELINVRKTFLEGEEDEYTKSSRRYLQDEENYFNRIKTYTLWVKKPVHLCSLLLARNGFICENETTVRCELCRCKFVYQKDTYSMYTKINDLCLLHLKNCPWKGKLMDLQILRLDGDSLQRDNLLREYQNVSTFLQSGTNDVPYVDIKKTIGDLLLIVKKHLANEDSKKKFLLFSSYVELFKTHYVEIFKNHKKLVDRGMHLIQSNYNHLKTPLVDEAFLNSLTYDPLDVHTYINIVADENRKAERLTHPDADLHMYFKIVNQMKDFQYEDVNIYKLIALLGWTYRDSPQGEDPNGDSHILYCRYCFREVNLGDYSTLSRRHNRMDLFKAIDVEPPGEVANESVDDARHALERLTGLAHAWVEVEQKEANEKETAEMEAAEMEAAEMEAAEKEAPEKEVEEKEAVEKEEAEMEAAEKETAEKEQEENPVEEKNGGEKERKKPSGEEKNDGEQEGEEPPVEEENDGKKEEEEPPREENNGGEKEVENPVDETNGGEKEGEPPVEEINGGEKKGNENASDDAKGDPNEGGGTKDDPAEEQEGFSFKWSIKQFFLPKKSTDKGDKNQSADDASPRECPPTSVNQGELTPNRKRNSPCARKRRKKKVQLKDILSRVFLEVSSYTENEILFSKAANDCYVLRGGPHLAYLDKEPTPAEDGTDGANCTGNTAECAETAGNTQKRTIRAFNLIENHRAFCPYMTEDLYSFSKITRLLFELVTSEFQRRYVMR
ncbi:hypothetical protein PVNG_00862 [Plasmodium vivax North Korean]|uniref:C3HC-type domain-containing protein n=1 Tax=Plasmodium vivax North Korean TaxID=1035514 RepID=A0A0J9TWE6_PLAVI|nr:hypothetical protein PVNG_00862 [Plasmodium vivax North Korean]